jgi:hypothetical protein
MGTPPTCVGGVPLCRRLGERQVQVRTLEGLADPLERGPLAFREADRANENTHRKANEKGMRPRPRPIPFQWREGPLRHSMVEDSLQVIRPRVREGARDHPKALVR